MKKTLGILVLLMSSPAWAIPVNWTLDNVSFADGTSVDGSFTYDADTNTYTDIFVETQGSDSGINFPPLFFSVDAQYDSLISTQPSDQDSLWLWEFVLYDCGPNFCDARSLELDFASSLTNSGGVISLNTSSREGAFSVGFSTYRNVVSGSVIGTVVPIPAAVWLFGSALGGLGWIRRRNLVTR